jgi:integrase
MDGGKRVRQSATFDIKADAEWWLRQAKRTGSAPDAELTVAQYLDRWLAGKRSIRDSTRIQYANHVGHLTRELGTVPVAKLERRHVEAMVDRLGEHVSDGTHKPLSPATVGKILTTLRSALEAGVPRELPDNPAAKVEAPRVEREPVRAVTRADVAAIVKACRDEWFGPLVRFLLGSGLRIGEAVALNHANVHDGWVELVKSKTSIRAVRVSADGMAALREAMGPKALHPKTTPVFKSPRTGQRLDRHALAHALPRHLKSKGLPRMTPHSLRHATATLLVASGVHMRVVAEQLGHANPSMTARVYAHVAPESVAAALTVLDEAVSEA